MTSQRSKSTLASSNLDQNQIQHSISTEIADKDAEHNSVSPDLIDVVVDENEHENDTFHWHQLFTDHLGESSIDICGTEKLSDALSVLMCPEKEAPAVVRSVHFVGASSQEIGRLPHTLRALEHFSNINSARNSDSNSSSGGGRDESGVELAYIGPEVGGEQERAQVLSVLTPTERECVTFSQLRYHEFAAQLGESFRAPDVVALLHSGLMPSTLERDWRETLEILAAHSALCVFTSFDRSEHDLLRVALLEGCAGAIACSVLFDARNPYRSLVEESLVLEAEDASLISGSKDDSVQVLKYAVNNFALIAKLNLVEAKEENIEKSNEYDCLCFAVCCFFAVGVSTAGNNGSDVGRTDKHNRDRL